MTATTTTGTPKAWSRIFAGRVAATMLMAWTLASAGLIVSAQAQECTPTAQAEAEQAYSTAYQFVTANQWAEAIPSLEQAIAACPSHWSSVELLAGASMRVKKMGAAQKNYRALIDGKFKGDMATADQRVLSAYGYVLLRNKNWSEGEKVFQTILVQDPANLEAHDRLAICYKSWRKPEKSIEHLEKLYDLHTDEAKKVEVAKRLGEAYKGLGDNAQATAWLGKSGGGGGSSLFGVGVDHMKKKEWQQAADVFKKFVAEKPDSAAGWKNLGQCYQKLSMTNEAASAYEKTLELDRSKHDVMSRLGLLYLDMGRFNGAGKLSEEAINGWSKDDPELGAMYYLQGKVYEKRDENYQAAISMFEKALGDSHWGDPARREIERQEQLIRIKEMQGG